MKNGLLQLDSLDLTDAEITAEINAANGTLLVAFNGAFDLVRRTFADGVLQVHRHVDPTGASEPDEILARRTGIPIAETERVCQHETVGQTLIFKGFTTAGPWAEWHVTGAVGYNVEISRRSIWDESIGEESEVEATSFEQEIARDEFAGACVMIEAPDSDETRLFTSYAQRCIADSYARGEHPFIPRVLERRVLLHDAATEGSPDLAIDGARDAWASKAAATVVYTDFGKTPQMRENILNASHTDRPIRFRRLFEPTEAQEFLESFNAVR